tara:strand:- start:1942 stop:2901 length:960 start_codon:yes stop_codon:yes gene_type:complete
MPSGYGFGGHIGLAKETTWGTAVGATDYVEALSESINVNFDRFDTKNIVGMFGEPDDEQGVKRISGDIVAAAHPVALLPWLVAATGIQSNAEVLSGFLHTHNLTMGTAENAANNPVTPLTLEIFRDVTSAQQYDGVQVAQLQLSAAPNQDLRMTASIIGKGEQNIAKTTASFPGSPTGPFTFDTCSISLAGAGTVDIEAFNLTIDHQLEGIPSLNAEAEIAKVRRTGPQLVRLSGSFAFEDITDYERFKAETEVALLANFTSADSFSLLIDIPRFMYTSFPTGMGDRGRQVISFDGNARWHSGSSAAIEFQLTNTTSGF